MNNPVEILKSVEEFKKDHPDANKIAFLIMRFDETEQYENIVRVVKDSFLNFGINLLRADDKQYHDDLFLNVLTYMHGCGIGVAIFDRITSDEFNPNVSLEVGYMMALSKPICFLKDESLRTLPTDLFGKLYKPFNTYKPEVNISKHIGQWLRDKRLDFSCYQCSILIDYNLTADGYNQAFLDQLISGVKLLSPNVAVKLLKVRQSDDFMHTVIDFEANRDFYEHLQGLHEKDRLSVVCGCKILDVSPIGDEIPRVAFISAGTGHEAFYSCHLQHIEGFEKCAEEAEKFLPEKTNKLDECVIYVTYHDGFYYYHSNFVQKGFIYPTKVQTEDNNLLHALKMISGFYNNSFLKPSEEEIVLIHHFKAKYALDERAVTKHNLKIDYCGTSRIFVEKP